jgi:NADPH:quinone reductase
MEAAAIDRFGPPSVLRVRKLPVPTPAPDEVLIAVHTAGVGSWDAKIRDGTWASRRGGFPRVLGTDGSGVIAATGSRVRRLQTGDRVWAYQYENARAGFCAQYVAVKASNAAPVPEALDMAQAGAGTVTSLTALQGIDDVLGLRRKETVLIFGASGAVGTMAVQLARHRGARVLAAASGRDGAALVKRLGAHEVIDPRKPDAPDRLRALAGRGLDAVLALAGSDMLDNALALLRPGGRVAYPEGVEPPPRRRRRRIEVVGYNASVGRRELARLERAVNQVRLKVPIATTFPLQQASAAHRRLEQGHVLGRIALRVAGR